MKSSTTKKSKNDTPRLITEHELRALTVRVYLYPEGWVVVDGNYNVKSTHRTQAEAIDKGRAMAKKRSGRLVIHARNGFVREWEDYWPGPVRFEPLKPRRPSLPPVNATRQAIREAVKKAIRRANAEAAQQMK